jgi:mono/diheme cytochrome c family protein
MVNLFSPPARKLLQPIGWAACAVCCQAAAAYEPQINYMLQCMGCHAPDGSGEPGSVPSLKSTLAPFAASAEGRRFIVQVPGASQSKLSDAELAQLLNWMIQNLSGAKPASFDRFTAAEVSRYRRTPLVRVQAAREKLLSDLKAPQVPP